MQPGGTFVQLVLKASRPMLALAPMFTLVTLLSGCGNRTQAAQDQPPEVSVIAVRHTSVPVSTELPGRTSPFLVAQVRARVDGIVLKREFVEGADVTEGQRLYQIDPAPYRAAFDSAKAQLTRARANVESTTAQAERDKVLVAGNAVSKQAYLNAVAAQGQANADVASGLAAVQSASINLGYTDIVAPISGRIGTSAVTQGAYVQMGVATLMATIQQIDPIYVDLNQTSVEGLQFRREVATGRLKLAGPDQAKVRLILEDGTEYIHTGTLQFTDITVDPGTDSVTVRAIFPNPHHVLLPGMFVRARIDQGTNNTAMLVPQDGVTHDRKGVATVLVVKADNKVALQTVSATRTIGDNWVVESGLNAGDRVIVAGVQRARPGMVVRPVLAQPQAERPPETARTATAG